MSACSSGRYLVVDQAVDCQIWSILLLLGSVSLLCKSAEVEVVVVVMILPSL